MFVIRTKADVVRKLGEGVPSKKDIKGTLFQGSSTKSVLEANKSLKHFSRSTTEGRSGNETGVTHSLSVVEESKLPFGVSPFNSRRRSLICE